MLFRRTLTLVLILLLAVALAGCAKIAHLDQLLTLKAYSDNKELQEKYVTQQNQKFEKLLAAVKEQTLKIDLTRKEVVAEFGDPVFTQTKMTDGQTYDVWLYRYATKYFNSEKVYLYFSPQGLLQKWDYVAPVTATEEQKLSDQKEQS